MDEEIEAIEMTATIATIILFFIPFHLLPSWVFPSRPFSALSITIEVRHPKLKYEIDKVQT
jgi:hypothetical protein